MNCALCSLSFYVLQHKIIGYQIFLYLLIRYFCNEPAFFLIYIKSEIQPAELTLEIGSENILS